MKETEIPVKEAYKFFKRINAILERLDLIQPFSSSDSPDEELVWGMKNQLALCFPNLTSKERRLVFDVHYEAIHAIYLRCHEARLLEKYGPENFAWLLDSTEKSHAKCKRRLEKYQLRLTLSAFQEKLLDCFMDKDREED